MLLDVFLDLVVLFSGSLRNYLLPLCQGSTAALNSVNELQIHAGTKTGVKIFGNLFLAPE